jgi:hypothetical protein
VEASHFADDEINDADSGPTSVGGIRSMNTQKYPLLSAPMRFFSLAAVVLCAIFAAERAMAQTVVIPAEFANREGAAVDGTVSNNPYRTQSLYLGAEFPQEPIEIIGMRRRPKAGVPTQSPVFRDLQVRLTTTNATTLNRDFVVNYNDALQPPIFVINGTVQTNTVRPFPDQSPRAFDYEFLWAEMPFRFDPADGTNLLIDFNAPFGASVPHQTDAIDSSTQGRNYTTRNVLHTSAFNFFDYNGRFPVTEFIYRPAAVPEPTSALLLIVGISVLSCRRRYR